MVETKVRLSLVVQSATLLSSQECEENPKQNYKSEKVVLTSTNRKGKVLKDVITIQTRKQRTVTHVINMSKEAYDYMLSTPTSSKLSKPTKYNRQGEVIERAWDKLSEKEKLNHHFEKIANDMFAISWSYQILDD